MAVEWFYDVVPEPDEDPLPPGGAPLPISEDGELGGVLGSAGMVLEPGAVPGLAGVPVAPVPPLYAPGSVRGS